MPVKQGEQELAIERSPTSRKKWRKLTQYGEASPDDIDWVRPQPECIFLSGEEICATVSPPSAETSSKVGTEGKARVRCAPPRSGQRVISRSAGSAMRIFLCAPRRAQKHEPRQRRKHKVLLPARARAQCSSAIRDSRRKGAERESPGRAIQPEIRRRRIEGPSPRYFAGM